MTDAERIDRELRNMTDTRSAGAEYITLTPDPLMRAVILAAAGLPDLAGRGVDLSKDQAHELTRAELDRIPDGARLHWTNWPGKPSVPVTRVTREEDGNIRFADGRLLCAFADELTLRPRRGLEER